MPIDRRHAAFPASGPIRVLIVDEHEISSHGLGLLLGREPDLVVVGTASSVAEAVRAAMTRHPDVALVGLSLPGGEGLRATERIRAHDPAVKVIMLTARTDHRAEVAAGCSAYVREGDPIATLLGAIRTAHQGALDVSPSPTRPRTRPGPSARGPGAALTPRELEVLNLSASGIANKEVARRLGVRLNTVRNHVQSILTKLHAHSKLEAVATAVRRGIIEHPCDQRAFRSPVEARECTME